MFEVVFVSHKGMMTIPTPTVWIPSWYDTIPDLLCVPAVLPVPAVVPVFPKNMMIMYQQLPRIRYARVHVSKYDAEVSTIPPNPVRNSIWSSFSLTLLSGGRFFRLSNRSWVAPYSFLAR